MPDLPLESSFRLKSIVDELKHYQHLLDERHNLLLQSLDYFKSCRSAHGKLDQLENQFRDVDVHQHKAGSQASFLENSLQQLDQIMMEVLGKGNSLIGGVGDKGEGSLGIKESMINLENRAQNLRSNYQSKNSEVKIFILCSK